jgi:hypothetical protein
LWIAAAVLRGRASYIPPIKYLIIRQAAFTACDSRAGLKDGLIDDLPNAISIPNLRGRGRSHLSDRCAAGWGEKDLFSRHQSTYRTRAIFVLGARNELGWGVQTLGCRRNSIQATIAAALIACHAVEIPAIPRWTGVGSSDRTASAIRDSYFDLVIFMQCAAYPSRRSDF